MNIINPSNKYKDRPCYKFTNTTAMNEYIFNCLNGNLNNKPSKSKFNRIKITALIPVYNPEQYIKSTIRSIQNQNMEEIEILIVDDYSTDNTRNIIYKLQEKDERIKIIENKSNRGTLYSRSIGAFNARGKYIMTIDNDDMFINDIFDICYEEAENDNIDILEFAECDKGINSTFQNKYCDIDIYLRIFKRDGIIIKQPELKNYLYQKWGNDFRLIDFYLWGECIKSTLYKRATIEREIFYQKVC